MDHKVAIVSKLSKEEIEVLNRYLKEAIGRGEPVNTDPKLLDVYYDGIAEMITKGEAAMALAYLEGEIIGSVTAMLPTSTHEKHLAKIYKLIIQPDFRGQGLSKKLLHAIEAHIKDLNREVINLCFYEGFGLAEFYQKQGYRLCGKFTHYLKINDKYIDMVYMEKLLK